MAEQTNKSGHQKPATIHDVARKAQVAVGTVSRFLNGHTIRKSNQIRVEAAISDLQFQRNSSAASILKTHTKFVGFILPAFDEFHTDVLATLIQTMKQAGFVVLPYSHGNQKLHLPDALEYFREHRVAAIITSGDAAYNAHDELLRALDCPLILYSNDLVDLSVDRVVVNDFQASKRATEHLIEMGHRHIGILTGDIRDTTGERRLQGFCEAMANAGLPIDKTSQICGGGWLQRDGYVAANEMLGDPQTRPTAVFSSNYLLNLGMFQYCDEHGISIPDDLSTVTFGDSKHYPFYGRGLTAVRFPVEQIAESLTHVFLKRLGDSSLPKSRTVKHACELILRGSVLRRTNATHA